jgi:predicted HTH transcriptional regulator
VATARQARGFPLAEDATPQAVLAHLRLLQQDRPTRAALLLFGYEPQRFMASSGIICAHCNGDPDESPQTCQGTLFEAIDQAMYFVLSKIASAPGAYEIPQQAVREAIVNAVAHRDYSVDASVQVTLWPDRLEVWNPGALPASLSLEQLRRPHVSDPANPLLAEPFYLNTYRAAKGSGTCDMIGLCRKDGAPEPHFALADAGFLVTLPRRPAPASVPDPVGGETEPETPPADLRVLELVRLLAKTGPLGTSAICERLGMGRTNFRERYLDPALAAGFIEPTIPAKLNSCLQQYRLTAKGAGLLASLRKN